MSVTVNMQIHGLKETLDKLAAYSADMRTEVSKAIQEGGLSIERDAKIRAPVDTGRLRSSIHYQPTGEFSCQIGDGVEYGVFVEYGTSKMRAQPFLRPAAEENKPKIEARVAKATQTAAK